jgi:DNA-binding transcriptional regulator GbsR (MarR family)
MTSSDPPSHQPAHAQPDDAPGSQPPSIDDVVRPFVEHWATMARLWGINATMAELFALMYISGGDWSAEELQERLRISRGNVSMNLRELLVWGVVHKSHRQGQRREFYRAEGDVWTIFRRIITERKRREVEPTLELLAATANQAAMAPENPTVLARAEALRHFFETINSLATRLVALEPAELQELMTMLDVIESNDETP